MIIYTEDGQAFERNPTRANVQHFNPRHAIFAPPASDPSEHIDEIVPGVGNRLWQGTLSADGRSAEWTQVQSGSSSSGAGRQALSVPNFTEEVTLRPDQIDDSGNNLADFVGSWAFYRPNGLLVWWNGDQLYTRADNRVLDSPPAFRASLSSAMGLVGTIYLPREDTTRLQDLFKPSAKDRDRIIYPAGTPASGGRSIAALPGQELFESAWRSAVFMVEDTFSEPSMTFDDRYLKLQGMLTVGGNGRVRLVRVEKMFTKGVAMRLVDDTPDDASLVITDPAELFPGATNARSMQKYRPTPFAAQRVSQVVARELDGSGKLQALYVDGPEGSAKVGEGQLWVTDGTKSEQEYQRKLKAVKVAIDTSAAPWKDRAAAWAAYTKDAAAHAGSEAAAAGNSTAARQAFAGTHPLGAVPVGTQEHAARAALLAAVDPATPIVGHGVDPVNNLSAWDPTSTTMFPQGALLRYDTTGRRVLGATIL